MDAEERSTGQVRRFVGETHRYFEIVVNLSGDQQLMRVPRHYTVWLKTVKRYI